MHKLLLEHRELHTLWMGHKPKDGAPAFKALAFSELLPHFKQLVVLRWASAADDFVIEALGSAVVDYFGRDWSGASLQQAAHPAQRAPLRRALLEAMSSGEPGVVRAKALRPEAVSEVLERLILPCRGDYDGLDWLVCSVRPLPY